MVMIKSNIEFFIVIILLSFFKKQMYYVIRLKFQTTNYKIQINLK